MSEPPLSAQARILLKARERENQAAREPEEPLEELPYDETEENHEVIGEPLQEEEVSEETDGLVHHEELYDEHENPLPIEPEFDEHGDPIIHHEDDQYHDESQDGASSRSKLLKRGAIIAIVPLVAVVAILVLHHHATPVFIPNNTAAIAAKIHAAQLAAKQNPANTPPPPPISSIPDGSSVQADQDTTAASSQKTAGAVPPSTDQSSPPSNATPTIPSESAWDKPIPAAPTNGQTAIKVETAANPFALKPISDPTQQLGSDTAEIQAATGANQATPSLEATASSIENASKELEPNQSPVSPLPIVPNATLVSASQYAVSIKQSGITHSFAIGQNAPGLGVIHSIQAWAGGWEVLTDAGIVRQ